MKEEQSSCQTHQHVNLLKHYVCWKRNIQPKDRDSSCSLDKDVDLVEDGKMAEQNIEGSEIRILVLPDKTQECRVANKDEEEQSPMNCQFQAQDQKTNEAFHHQIKTI